MDQTVAENDSSLIIPLIFIALIAAAMLSDTTTATAQVSDARLKTGIVPVGTAANGLPLYHYSYIGSTTVFEGVMAQDVLMHTPSAIVTLPSDIMAVNYDMLGLTLRVVD